MRQVAREAQKPWLKCTNDQEISCTHHCVSRRHISRNVAPHAFPRQHRYPCLVLGNIATRHFGLKPVGRSEPLRRPRPLASRLFYDAR